MAWSAAIGTRVDAQQGRPLFAWVEATATGVVTNGFGYHSGRVLPSGGQSTWKPLLEGLSSLGQQRDLKTGSLTVSSLTVTLSNRGGDVLQKVVATEGIPPVEPSHRVALYIGYADLAFSSWDRIWLGRVQDVKQVMEGVSWEVRCLSNLERANDLVMASADGKSNDNLITKNEKLDEFEDTGEPAGWFFGEGGSSAVQENKDPDNIRTNQSGSCHFNYDGSGNWVHINKTTADALLASTYYSFEVWAKASTVLSLSIQIAQLSASPQRYLSAAAGTAAGDTGTWTNSITSLTYTVGTDWTRILVRFKMEGTDQPIRVLIGNQSGAVAARGGEDIYLNDASITKKVVVRGNPVDIVVAFLGDPATVSSNFPVEFLAGAPEGLGMGVTMTPGSLNDVAGYTFKTERDDWYPSQVVETEFLKPVKWFSYLQEDFFRLWGFCYMDSQGQIAFKGNHPQAVASTYVEWTDDEMKGVPDWSRLINRIVNAVIIEGDWNALNNKYVELARLEDAASIADNGRREMRVKSRWLRTEHNGVSLAGAFAGRILQRLGRAPEQVNVDELVFREADVGISDSIQVTNAVLPDLVTGLQGKLQEVFEVEAVSMDVDGYRASARLVKTYYKRPAFITPNTHPDYLSSSITEREYGYVSDNADQEMSNGDLGYKVV